MWSEPDYTQTVWPSLEAKLGRKMTAEENKKLMYRGGGMFKEWFFNELAKCSTPEEAEELFARATGPWTTSEAKPKAPEQSWFDKLLNKIFG